MLVSLYSHGHPDVQYRCEDMTLTVILDSFGGIHHVLCFTSGRAGTDGVRVHSGLGGYCHTSHSNSDGRPDRKSV